MFLRFESCSVWHSYTVSLKDWKNSKAITWSTRYIPVNEHSIGKMAQLEHLGRLIRTEDVVSFFFLMSLPLPDWHKCEIQDYQIILGKLQGAELAIVFFFKT